MASRTFNSVSEALNRAFPERRIYIRSDKQTRHWTISPISQLGAACVLAAGLSWSAYTSYVYIDNATDSRTSESRFEAAKEAYETRLAAMTEQQRLLEDELNRSNARGDIVTKELSEKQRLLVDTANRYQNARAELDGIRAEFEFLSSKRREEQAEIDSLNEELAQLRLAMAKTAENATTVDETLATFSHTIGKVISARDEARIRADTLDLEVAALNEEIEDWQARQDTLLAQLEQATQTSIENLGSVFAGIDVNMDKILTQARRDYTGRGGAFEPAGPGNGKIRKVSSRDSGEELRVAALMTDLERVSLMRVAIDRLPVGMPTEGARITSGFGGRSDPFHGGRGNHQGLDMAAPTGTPIYSTAEGVVTFSGRQRGYGNVVKIRHAFGFETVYAHLSKSRVQVGERVERGKLIADMGSTGRSTGSHLHYEVRIDGRPVDPRKFIGAARNVL